ncbi:MAG: DUF6048 family protein [Bacteroidaceae bacterium]|nr:DUF6048 family protein [Bacteroidaceae bacterium]
MAKTSRYICILVSLLCLCLPVSAKQSKYRVEKEMPKARLLNGIGVGVDGVGFIMKAMSGRFANMEVSGRLNLLEKYFPIVELGIGECTREGNEQPTKFHTSAPYFRIGADYNLTKKRNGNRFLVGLRYGVSNFKYDYANPDFKDEVYGGATPLEFKDLEGKAQWVEACAGVETKLWSFVRLGFNIRYKMNIYKKFSPHGDPWFVPGYGKFDTSTWGGSVNLMFDI